MAAVNNDSTNAEVTAAQTAIAAIATALGNAADVPKPEKAANQGTHDALEEQLNKAMMARQMAMDEAEKQRMAMMQADAMKLYAGISAPGGTGANTRTAAYGSGENTNDIAVTIGEAEAVNLKEDKKTMVAKNCDWEGKRYFVEPDGSAGTYEAHVYSNISEPTEGRKFGSAAALPDPNPADGYQYQLNNDANADQNIAAATELKVTGVDEYSALVASSRFDQSAGKKEFKRPDNAYRVVVPGTFHGVSGNYYCVPASGETCSATVADKGFTLANGTWTFKASDNNAKVMSASDTIYASYGWWIHKSEDGKTYTASAFVSDKGAVPDATGLDTLKGTATYMGGAAGKYALYSTTGGTNDAGHFTARAMLEANFTENNITGTIDNFIGADGESRNWSVELKEAAVAPGGAITRIAEGQVDNDTVWTIGGTAAAASGEWSGSLQDNGTDGVPKVGTGTFYTHYNEDGKMVGAFGVNKQ